MAVTSIDIDVDDLEVAKNLTGAKSNREVVAKALKTLIAVNRQSAAIERIIAREFTDEQIHATVVHYDLPGRAETA